MPITYSKCDAEVQAIGKRMMSLYHGELAEVETKIAYLFAHAPKGENGEPLAPAVSLNGYPCAAKVKVIGLKERADGRADAEVLIDADEWAGLSEPQRNALIDHELTHLELKVDGETGAPLADDLGRPRLKCRKHDHQFGWFDVIANRHGDASYEVKQAKAFADEAGQLYFGWKAPPERSTESMPAAMPAKPLVEAIRNLCPKDGGEISAVTISSGGESVILTANTRKKINKMLREGDDAGAREAVKSNVSEQWAAAQKPPMAV